MVTDATGTRTVISAPPALPWLVAVMVTVPVATALTSPAAFTVAMAGSPLVQTTGRSSGLPPASRGVAVSCRVAPTETAASAGVTSTEFTATRTVMAAAPTLPSLVAVMLTVPVANAVISPLASTATTAGFSLAQTTGRLRTLPSGSRRAAVSCAVSPMSSVTTAGSMVTPSTTARTAIPARPETPSLVALMTAVPRDTPVTTPVADTSATAGLLDCHATVRSVSVSPQWQVAVTANWTDCPTMVVSTSGVTANNSTACTWDSVVESDVQAAAQPSAPRMATPVRNLFRSGFLIAVSSCMGRRIPACCETYEPLRLRIHTQWGSVLVPHLHIEAITGALKRR